MNAGKGIVLGWFLGGALLCGAGAGGAAAQSLPEALAMAYGTNPSLVAERATLRATDEEVARALSGWRPTITFDSEYRRRFTDSKTTFGLSGGEQIAHSKSLELSATQPLFRGGRTVAQTRQAENLVLAGRANLIDVEQQVLLAAATAYMDVVRDQSVVDLNINNEQVLRRQLEATRDRFEVGEVTRTDVSQAVARVADATASRVAAEGDLEISRANFEAVIGTPPGKLEFPDPGFGQVTAKDVDDVSAVAEQQNPAIIRASFLERAALFDINVAGGVLLPEVTLDTSVRRDLEPNTFTVKTDTFEVGVNVRVPLYQSGDEYARVRQLRQTAVQRRRELEQARRDVDEGAAETWHQLVTARARIRSFEASVRANQVALDGVEQEAEVGARTVLDVLDAQQELFNARVNLVRARRDEAVAAFRVLQVAGNMTAPKLGLAVEEYDPTAHYFEVRDKFIGFGSDFEGGSLLDIDTERLLDIDTEGLFDFLE